MSMERARRDRFTTAGPIADEYKMAVLLLGLLGFLAVPLAVQASAAWMTAGTFALPHGHFIDAYSELCLDGRFGGGLPRVVARDLPADAVMWVLTGFTEMLLLGSTVLLGSGTHGLPSPRSLHGLATPAQAATALGVRPLRRSAEVIRPDLRARSRRRVTPARTL